jgi:hypothetical protein
MAIVHSLLAAGADVDAADRDCITARQILGREGLSIDLSAVDVERARIARMRLDFVRCRAFQVCLGLQSLQLDALQLCEILVHACGPAATFVAFHHWWKIATTVKHFACNQKEHNDIFAANQE